MSRIVLFNKPYQVLSQFTDDQGRATLADFIDQPGIYAAGRLDYDSEGLLLLTDDGRLQQQISHPKFKLEKTYWAQVDGRISADAIKQLKEGVELKDGMTRPAKCRQLEPPSVWPRNPPIRQRNNDVTSWLELKISEGRNRQVRRMTAAVGFPTLRLIRMAIGSWKLADLQPGQWRSEQAHLPRPSQTEERRSSQRQRTRSSKRPGATKRSGGHRR